MQLHAVQAPDRQRLVIFDVFIGLATVAVVGSLFLPWFTAEYAPHWSAANVCFDASVPEPGAGCLQNWSGWRTISLHWLVPVVAFVAVPSVARRVVGERPRPQGAEFMGLAGAILAVVALGFFITPDLEALNAAQTRAAATYSAEPWVYTSVSYAYGIFNALGFGLVAFIAAGLRVKEDPESLDPGRAQGTLIVLAMIAALFPITYLGEVLTRF